MKKSGFISLEGCEGCGKSTQALRLYDVLTSKGHEVVMTREPGGTPTGEMIRNLLQHHASGENIVPSTEVLLFAASRAQHVANVIHPALQAGKWVICDRFVDSSLAYQSGGREIAMDDVLSVNEYALAGCWPDLTLWFDLPVEVAMARVTDRGEQPDRFESEALAFHQRVSQAYVQLSQRFADRFDRVNAEPDVDTVSAQVLEIVNARFGDRL
jgi:dTMP kinase